MKKKILIISYSWLHKDPRVLVQYNTLHKDCDIETFALSAINDSTKHFDWRMPALSFFQKLVRRILLLLKQYGTVQNLEIKESGVRNIINYGSYDLMICNDLSAIPIGLEVAKGKTPIWLDLHEYAPRQFEHDKRWKLFFQQYHIWQCKKMLPKMNTITTVCQGLATEYEKQFGIKIHSLIYNAPNFAKELAPTPVGNIIKLVHHGGATPHRKLELMIELMKHLGSGYSLDFFLMANNEISIQYENQLKELAKNLPVTFNKPVATAQIPFELNRFDMGVFILEPVNFNYLNALPNKLFEFIQARLAVAVSPNHEMKRVTLDNKVGVVASDYTPEALAKAIKEVSVAELNSMKERAHNVSETLSSVRSARTINGIITDLISA